MAARLRGERDHCKMVAIPTIKDEDAKRPHREREGLVREQTRIVNRMKAALIGIRGFNPKLKRAAGSLEDLRTPEGAAQDAPHYGAVQRGTVVRRAYRRAIRAHPGSLDS
jgi:transposase